MCCEQAWGIFFIFELLYALSLAQQKGKKELAFFTIPTWITDDLFHLHEARDLQQVQYAIDWLFAFFLSFFAILPTAHILIGFTKEFFHLHEAWDLHQVMQLIN